MDQQQKLRELETLRAKVRTLESELASEPETTTWPPRGPYTTYYATTGFLLGGVGALASLVFNIIGSVLWPSVTGTPQHPLRLVQVYLTFPLGASALQIDSGVTLAIGCCLYLATGMLYGMLFQVLFFRLLPDSKLTSRLVAASVLSLLIWLVNFYGILSWLQPLLFGGTWIIDLVPWWVAALTHLVFGWTMALVYPLGIFVPYGVKDAQ
jgi:hypothetical protein